MSLSDTVYSAEQFSAGYGVCPVLHELSFRIRSGEMIALIGPNGAGKTTLLRVLVGDILALSGAIQFRGAPLAQTTRKRRACHIAYVPPALDLAACMSVHEFVALGRTPYLTAWQKLRAEDQDAIEEALTITDLVGLANRDVHELSEGEKHRAMIALGLAQAPDVLLLDEPTAHLDIKHAWHTMELIHGLHERKRVTVILSSHDLNIAAAYCSRLMLLERGRIVSDGVPREVLDESLVSRVYDYPIHVLPGDPPRVFPARSSVRTGGNDGQPGNDPATASH